MKAFLTVTKKLSTYTSSIAGIILVAMICLTFADIVGRAMGMPVKGTYDMVTLMGALLAGFALPRASLQGAHVNVDLVSARLSGKARKTLLVITKLSGTIFFLIGAFYLVAFGRNLLASNTLTMTLRLPHYPVAFGLAAGCLIQCLVLVSQIFEEEGQNNE